MFKKITAILLLSATLLSITACDMLGLNELTKPAQTSGAGTDGPDTTPAEQVIKPNYNGIVLNEAMASNKSTIADDYGEYSDWIELYNGSSAELSLKNYIMTDSPDNKTKFIFPDIRIPAGGYLVIWASGRNVYNQETNSLHLPFKLSKTGETVCLINPSGVETGRITMPEMPTDISAAPAEDGRTVLLAEPTPGEKNVTALYTSSAPSDEPLNLTDKTVSTVRINEYATKKSVTFTDGEGDYGAWAEIYNYGTKDVPMKGLFLSDDESKKAKWAFPDVTVPAGGYITVFMLGKDIAYDGGELHATFTLSGKESVLGIYNGAGAAIDEAAVYALEGNITCGRSEQEPDKLLFYPIATRNAANTVKGFEDINSARYPKYKAAYISEVVAVNATLDKSPDGKTYSSGELYDYYKLYDYVELKNPSDQPLELSDLYIGKKGFDEAIRLPSVSLPSNGYRLIYFSDQTTYNTRTDSIFVDLGLNRYGNDIYLFDSGGTVIDSIDVGLLFDKTSAGRSSDGEDDTVHYYKTVTPGKDNSEVTYKKAVASPSFDKNGGYVDQGTTVTLTAPAGCVIYYTTDGSVPDVDDQLYREPVKIDKTVTIRARAFKSDSLPSDEASVSFIVGRQHNMPVVMLNAEVNDLFSEKTGIFADGPDFNSESTKYDGPVSQGRNIENSFFADAAKYAHYWNDWERPVSFTYIDESGSQVLNFNAGIKVFGQYSRVHDQKSVAIRLRDKYGIKKVIYPFFGDDYINVFSSLILRAAGQDANRAHIRDAFVARALLNKTNNEVMNYRPVVVYINGEYYGIYDLRERISDDFVADHTGADPDNLDRIKGLSIVQSGTYDNYKALYNFVTTKNMSVAENYAYAESQIDIDNFIDYWIAAIYFANTDPGNIKFYRENKEGAKWRWIPYDFDWSLSSEEDRINLVFNESSLKVYALLKSLIKNNDFKKKFISRFCELLNDTLSPDRLIPLLREMTNEISEEMEYHIARWNYRNKDDDRYISGALASCPGSIASWERHISSIETWLKDRDTKIISQLKKKFGLSDADLRAYGLKR